MNTKLTKEEFQEALIKYKPGIIERVWFNAFGRGMHWTGRSAIWWIAMISTMVGFPMSAIDKWYCLLFVPLAFLAACGMIAIPVNNWRIRKICRHLDINTETYNYLIQVWK